MDSGKPIKAAEGGTVIVATRDAGYGLYVIDHGGSILPYGHCQTFGKPGDVVVQGQTIALVGNADIYRSHLHFEVRIWRYR